LKSIIKFHRGTDVAKRILFSKIYKPPKTDSSLILYNSKTNWHSGMCLRIGERK
jgi:hypothetical protein